VADSLKYTTPNGKVVYGGGGIIPDVFVPIDANDEYEKVSFAISSRVIDNFVFEVLEKERKYYSNLTREDFVASYKVPDTIISNFKEYVSVFARRKWSIDTVTYANVIKHSLKAAIAAQLFDDNLAYQIKDEDDKMIQKVKELLRK